MGTSFIINNNNSVGKTCGFLLPAFHGLLQNLEGRKRGPPGVLVLAPTRELACQIEAECVKFGKSSNIRSVCVYGGSPKSQQVRVIKGGIEVLIATPGRLNDLLDIKAVDLEHISFLGKISTAAVTLYSHFFILFATFDALSERGRKALPLLLL